MTIPKSLIGKVKNESITNLVLNKIKDALLNRELNPGDMMPSETELTKSLGVSKSSVREAIKMLEILGVVESIQGKGTFVKKKADSKSINPLLFELITYQGNNEHIYNLRKMFEPAYCLMAQKNATNEDLENIEMTIKNFKYKIETNNQTAESDIAFHKALLAATHNGYVIKIGNTILELFRASIQTSMEHIPEVALKDHNRIWEAFKSKDPDLLNDAILKSYEGWSKSLKLDLEN